MTWERGLHLKHKAPGHICLDATAEQADGGFTRCGYEADTGRISPAPLFTSWFADTTRGTLQQRQTALDGANQNVHAVLYLVKEKAGAILVECNARIPRARYRWRRVENNQQVWKKSKGHHQVVVLASQYHITQRPRRSKQGTSRPQKSRVFLIVSYALTPFFWERSEAGHQLRRRLQRGRSVLRCITRHSEGRY